MVHVENGHGGTMQATPVVVGGVMYTATGHVAARDARTGALKWQYPDGPVAPGRVYANRGLAVNGGDRLESIGGQDPGEGDSRFFIVIDDENRRPGDFAARSGIRSVVDRIYSIRFATSDQR